jgi:hypothetical protein
MKLTIHIHPLLRSRMVELFFHFPVELHGKKGKVVPELNYLSTMP